MEQTECNPLARAIAAPIARLGAFITRQKANYRVAVTRAAVDEFLRNLTAQYDAIYTMALGASSVELGVVSGLGNGFAALIAMPVGWLVDRHGFKRFFVWGTALLALVPLIYALAPTWHALVVASILYAIALRLTGTGCSVISLDAVENEDRVTAQNLCAAFRSILSLAAPLMAAPLVTAFGGMTPEGIRPLYAIRFVGCALVLLLVATKLKEVRNSNVPDLGAGMASGFRNLFQEGRSLGKWLVISSLTSLPLAVVPPFLQVFAHQVKGANQYVLGAMATATILARLVVGIPLGRLADRIGRKKVIFLLSPLWYGSLLLLIWSKGPLMLIVASALWVFYTINSGVTGAMALELVPVEETGKWSGLQGLVRGVVSLPAPILGGLLWERVGPVYVFLIPVALDLMIRIPLLITVPETLDIAHRKSQQCGPGRGG